MVADYCFGCMEQCTTFPCPKCGYSPTNDTLAYALRPGSILYGKYLVGKVLGQGGFGITYIGLDLQTNQKVAIKEYFPTGHVSRQQNSGMLTWYNTEVARAAMQNGQELVLKEARKMSKVCNVPQVVQVHSVFQDNGTAYICMDYIEGKTLKDHLKQTGPLPWEQAKKIFLPVMEAMAQVHNAGLIHRDLSPDNLMLQPDGGVKILDLGAAKDLNLNTGKSSMQVAKSGFSPLEQYMQQGNSGTWTDVYALAATLYYTLTGVLPPSAIDRMDNDTLKWNLPGLQMLPPEVLSALRRAMILTYRQRTQTMAEFAAELTKKQAVPDSGKTEGGAGKADTAAASGGHAGGKTAAAEKNTGSRKKWWIAGIAAAAAICLLIGIGAASGEDNPGEQMEAPTESENGLMEKQLLERADQRADSCEMDTYDYQDGARMEVFFDKSGRECLRIYMNAQGQEEFTFLAEYNARGDMVERYGFENRKLMSAVTWTRNDDGNATEVLFYGEGGVLTKKTTIEYDAQGRDISHIQVDAQGNVLLQGQSEYDANGCETYRGEYSSGESFLYQYDSDGNMLEGIQYDAKGEIKATMVYHYDSEGRETGYLNYDADGNLTYSRESLYTGDLLTGEISHSYYEDTEYVTEYEMIYGPGDTQFGERILKDSYGGITEYVRGIDSAWLMRSYTFYTNPQETNVSLYNWDGEYIGYETRDPDGRLTYQSETLYDENGVQIGSIQYAYNADGSYYISRMNENYNYTYRETYDSAGNLTQKQEYRYDSQGESLGFLETVYAEDGSWEEKEWDADYNILTSRSYDSAGALVSMLENEYDSAGKWCGSVSTDYYYDGTYMVTVKDANYRIVSQKTYSADGKLIKSG